MPHFSFDTTGAKEKFAKENAEREISHSAECEEVREFCFAKFVLPLGSWLHSTAQAFGKA